MAYRLEPTKIVTITKEGECRVTITLDLNININPDDGWGRESAPALRKEDPEDPEWIIPDFGKSKHVQFGKEISSADE